MATNIYQYGQRDNVAGDKVDNSQTNNMQGAQIGNVAKEVKGEAKLTASDFTQNNNANTAELLKLIASLRQNVAQFPEDVRDGIIIDIEDVEGEIKKPEPERNQTRLKRRLAAIIAAATAIAIPIAGITDFTNTALELGSKLGIELQLPPSPH